MLRDFWKHSMLFSYWKKNSMIWLFLKYIHNFCWYCRLCFVLNLREAYLFCCLTYKQRDKYIYRERETNLFLCHVEVPQPPLWAGVSLSRHLPRLDVVISVPRHITEETPQVGRLLYCKLLPNDGLSLKEESVPSKTNK